LIPAYATEFSDEIGDRTDDRIWRKYRAMGFIDGIKLWEEITGWNDAIE
jgi:hypothetical protein